MSTSSQEFCYHLLCSINVDCMYKENIVMNYPKLETLQVCLCCTFIWNSIYQIPINCSIIVLWLPFRVVGGSFYNFQCIRPINWLNSSCHKSVFFFLSWMLKTTVVLTRELFYVHWFTHILFRRKGLGSA